MKLANEDNHKFGDQTGRAPGVFGSGLLTPEFLDRLSWWSAGPDAPGPGHMGDRTLE